VCCLGGAEEEESVMKIRGMATKINRCVWGPCNTTIISGEGAACCGYGTLRYAAGAPWHTP